MTGPDLFAENIACVDQAVRLLRKIDENQYRRSSSDYLGSSFGGHCRHIIEHYRQLLTGMAAPFKVDYDARKRDPDIEVDPDAANQAFEDIKSRLDFFKRTIPLSTVCQVRANAVSDEQCEWQNSSIGRELQFVLSHSVHHYAILAIMCRDFSVALEEDFGMAPSTVRYKREQQAAGASA